MFNFQRGDFVPVSVQPTNGALTVLNIVGHTLDLTVLLFDVTNTGSGGNTARLGGKADVAGTVNLDHDADAPLYLAPYLVTPGTSGLCLFNLSPTRAIQIPTIIEKLHYQSAVDNRVQASFDVKMNSRAGLFVFPAL